MTNFEKIKAMNAKKMAQFLSRHMECIKCPMVLSCSKFPPYDCIKKLQEWLKSEVKEDES